MWQMFGGPKWAHSPYNSWNASNAVFKPDHWCDFYSSWAQNIKLRSTFLLAVAWALLYCCHIFITDHPQHFLKWRWCLGSSQEIEKAKISNLKSRKLIWREPAEWAPRTHPSHWCRPFRQRIHLQSSIKNQEVHFVDIPFLHFLQNQGRQWGTPQQGF